ncbi:hypothetical protein C6A77_10615 [Pseudomonas sp. AFG_SD02_1510_Pfu_092]|uniref:hypothetical protein n=1 Tax=Pseudomonas sp. AFG_SD02_1510_Pfu_092 TaxID=2259497 RepID=UPI000DEFBDF1|nr:hypothetical protein [Pseudomonas sp. AFG_SD02_1510_Pfu_092]RCL26976.1 hypothetical protein C6A77_10615 [Pseudomonas sp. AFG_SD02_1510_Pfu_092]
MRRIISMTFGGLTPSYYLRQLFFGSLFAALILGFAANSTAGLTGKPGLLLMAVVSTLLYPYSRFVYESVVGFIMGNNVFFVNALFMLSVKVFTMALCWSFAIFIAPAGLAYLYWHHSRSVSQ